VSLWKHLLPPTYVWKSNLAPITTFAFLFSSISFTLVPDLGNGPQDPLFLFNPQDFRKVDDHPTSKQPGRSVTQFKLTQEAMGDEQVFLRLVVCARISTSMYECYIPGYSSTLVLACLLYSLAFSVLPKAGVLDWELLLTGICLLSPLRDVVASGLQGTSGGGCGTSLSL
jgi:hypothetical protein